ncbi:TonB-dependent receptor domain-containing protein [Chitinophagaceae bacterium MMS25-I14]
MYRHFFILLLALFTVPVFAGNITGVLKDAGTNTPLTGVIISVKNTSKGASTDIDGKYLIEGLPDGKYEVIFSMIGYKKQSQSVTIKGNSTVTLDFSLAADGSALKEVTVKTGRMTHTENAVTMEIRKSSTIVSGISAAQISKTMDRNAADVVKRIPGVTIQEDRFITVRGLADRYNTVWLNDAGAPSSETDKKAFSFDLIPSGLIDRILVFKTPSPELPGDFAGGMVKVYTSSIPAKTSYTLGVQTSYREGSTGTDFNYTKRQSGDWIGYDNGSRNIPSIAPGFIDKNAQGNENVSRAFANTWGLNSKKQPLDLRISGSASNIFKLGRGKLGNTFGFSYANTSTNNDVQRYDWQDTAKQYHYNDKQSVNKVNLAVMDNIGFAIGNSRFEFKNLYNQVGTSLATYRTNVQDSDLVHAGFNNIKAYSEGYENRRTYTTQLGGTHHNGNDTRKYNWTLGYSDLFRNQPDLRRIKYAENPNTGQYYAQIPTGSIDIVNGGGRYFAEIKEKVYSFTHQFTQKIKISDHFDFDINAGNYIEYKKRSFSAREIGYRLTKQFGVNDNLVYLPIDQIFAPENVGGQYLFNIDEATPKYDSYSAENKLIASFVSFTVPVGRLKIVAGVRNEHNIQSLNGYSNQDAVSEKVTTNYYLPSVNVSYNFTEKNLVRLAYGKTLNRPEFREWAPVYFYDFDRSAGAYGTLYGSLLPPYTLKVAEVQNLDARWELYPSSGELIHAGVFYKSFTNPIQQIRINTSGENGSFTFVNGQKAYVAGVELDVRKNLHFLDDAFGSKIFKNLVLVGNLSLSKSEVTVDTTVVEGAIHKSRFQGQSDYVVNAGLFYQNDDNGLQGSVLYNIYGPRLFSLGSKDNESIGEMPFQSLDISLSKTFAKKYIISLGVQNLLGQTVRFVEDVNQDNKFNSSDKDFTYSSYKPGRYVSFGVKVKL